MERPLSQFSTKLERQLIDVLTHYPSVTMAFLFGSLAAGHDRMESDLDLAVAATTPLTSQARIHLIENLAVAIGRPVDLIDLAQAHGPLLQLLRPPLGARAANKKGGLVAALLTSYNPACFLPPLMPERILRLAP